jgi:hypothetical protein
MNRRVPLRLEETPIVGQVRFERSFGVFVVQSNQRIISELFKQLVASMIELGEENCSPRLLLASPGPWGYNLPV